MCGECFDEVLAGSLWITGVGAGEQIHSRVAGFGPAVDGEVTFGQQGDGGDSVRFEVMAGHLEHGGASDHGSFFDPAANAWRVVESIGRAAMQFKQEVSGWDHGDAGITETRSRGHGWMCNERVMNG